MHKDKYIQWLETERTINNHAVDSRIIALKPTHTQKKHMYTQKQTNMLLNLKDIYRARLDNLLSKIINMLIPAGMQLCINVD